MRPLFGNRPDFSIRLEYTGRINRQPVLRRRGVFVAACAHMAEARALALALKSAS